MLRTMTVTLALLAAGAVGCGSDDDGDGSGGSGGSGGASGGSGGSGGTSGGSGGGSSVPSDDKQLGDLTDAEITALCEANKPALIAISESACTVVGLGEADQAACETARDECEAQLADAGPIEIDCTDTSLVDYTGCEATVGDLLGCSDDLVAFAGGLSCSDAGNLPEEPACSIALQEQCPDVYTVQQ